jgi:hypothetical protein
MDMSKLKPAELAAAMRTGTAGWGRVGSSTGHARYSLERPRKPGGQRKCHCGCNGRATHACMANGVRLGIGCELSVRRWVRTGHSRPVRSAPV